MTHTPNLKIYSEADLLAIEAQSLSPESKELICLYARKHTVVLQRCEEGHILESAIFGCECWKVFREWLEEPMQGWEKRQRLQDLRRPEK